MPTKKKQPEPQPLNANDRLLACQGRRSHAFRSRSSALQEGGAYESYGNRRQANADGN